MEYLVQLDCSSNLLTDLDVSKNFSLTHLNCSNNYLTSLDVSNNTNLVHFYCSNNQLTSAPDLHLTPKPDGHIVDITNNNLECDDYPDVMALYLKSANRTTLHIWGICYLDFSFHRKTVSTPTIALHLYRDINFTCVNPDTDSTISASPESPSIRF